ncbi:hypothetical protein NON00_00315 [Roseomonas sp. GC11]|uniref:hypothetical protein n=1 Tax=Roseomonas sp. GC11 TaxID=2950546 RepID=UPI0021098E17|nr:hypothetical protein [Roseomonas sp. GC11]MCQ4158370.1 hypothetical protein [Roseomonas sp. GC11]
MPPRLTALLLLPLLAAGCAAEQRDPRGQQHRHILLQRLPTEVTGFTVQPDGIQALPAQAAPQGGVVLQYRFRQSGPDIRISLRGSLAAGAAEGPATPEIARWLQAQSMGFFLLAGAQPGMTVERGPDFSVNRRGSTVPLLHCIDVRARRQENVLRDLTCATTVEGQLLSVQMLTAHKAEHMENLARIMGEFSGTVVAHLRQETPAPDTTPGATPPAPPTEGLPPEMLRQLRRT